MKVLEIVIVTLYGVFSVIFGQIIQDGPCDPSVPVEQRFNILAFPGKWYEMSRSPNPYQSGDCSFIDFDKNDENTFDIENVIINNNFFEKYNGSAEMVEHAKFRIKLENFDNEMDYWVIMTIGDNFLLTYSCEDIHTTDEGGPTKSEINFWKLSRRVPSFEVDQTIHAAFDVRIMDLFGINVTEIMYNVDHSEHACYTLPVLEDGGDVILPGQCEELPVIKDLDYEAFSGRWHKYASYENNEKGSCINNVFNFNSGDITILNSRVIDEKLVSRVDSARAGEDGAFVFTHDSEDGPVSHEIYILDTDYNSYAVTYGCENVDENQKRIYSQIMTRKRIVNDELMKNIDAVLGSFIDLNTRYYQYTNQSDHGCFYYPEHVEGQPVVFGGLCNMNIKNMDNFDLNKFEGIWHVIENYPNNETPGTCVNYEYAIDTEQKKAAVNFRNTQVVDERLIELFGGATFEDGIFTTEINSSVLYSAVLDTDYTSYALVYSCMNINEDERGVWSWKLSRTKEMPSESDSNINRIIDTVQELDQRYYEAEDQSVEGCFFYPLPVKGQPVVFPGQCNENITVVENLDINKFQGTWNEIEAYPKTQQPGECISFQFSTRNNNLEFTMTEVYDYYLREGSGVLVADLIESAKFTANITLNGEELTIPYWILATDYDSYALAYSCININNDFRGIWSWKLSRENTMSEAANAAINAVTENIVVLNDDYFEETEHSVDACFYLPDLEPEDPVIFTGQCDDTIPVVANFNEENYSGLWHIISSYTADYQNGTCNDVEYSINDGKKEIKITQVTDDQRLEVESGTIIQVGNSGAKYVVNYNERPEMEFWILDTDYDSYSLLYSCENIDRQHRRVWSWKLSRERTLTKEADDAINKAIDDINVLNNRYYQTINNTEESCFYFPEVNKNETVSFRGQCDMNIPTVQNFDIERYLKTWYDIESYPQLFQEGTCPMTIYERLDATRIKVTITQVVEQELESVIGEARLAGDDGSAKFIVSFPLPNGEVVESNYWVLDTDYVSYALVYSCVNTEPDRRSISTWKLSRSPELTPESNAAINTIVDSINVLHQDYYIKRKHTANDCFFYPDNEGGPVFLDGQCPNPDDMTQMDPFDKTRFSDTWHEISRFPSELQTGECSNIEINFDRSEIKATIIREEKLFTETGSLSDVGNTGYFVANFADFSIPIFILDTDYNDYALLYGCKNVSPDKIQVYSWKLGRKREGISEEAHTKINVIVREHPDLHFRYYEDTDQGHYACFHYPEFDNPSNIELPGPCNETIIGKNNFNIEEYQERWFEVSRYPSTRQVGQCPRSYYYVNNDAINVSATYVKDEKLISIDGIANLASDGSGLLNIKFNNDKSLDYYVLETDYNNYALVYSCMNLNNGNREVTSWILSREPTIENQYLDAIKPVIEATQGLRDEYYINTDQGDDACFYVPEVDLDKPVVFRGQCDDIKGVENFDIQRYLGWWHEIEHYPTGSPTGKCISYQYESNGGQYSFIQTSVFDNNGDVKTGRVEVTNDGRLRKTFSNGESIDMWILATDYETYSLMYSCENIDKEYRRVWSAKYSKERSLSQSAQDDMQRIIDDTPLLYNQFYTTVDQSTDACFYYPENNSPYVVIPGQCDNTIPVVKDFKMNEYQNTWYLIEDYPHPQRTGDCSGSIYDRQNEQGEFRARTFQLVDNDLEFLEGTGSVNSNDGSARLTVNFPEPETNSTITTEIFVLATDYEGYSLVYTCRNLNKFQRYIGAWKLSRTRTLSSEATTIINTIINQREELHQPYFSRVRQDDDCPSSSNIIKYSLFLIILCLKFIF